ncbi:MAG: hypothetical protein H6744_19695 [Deltaproteobacteria bacterium]|nr:hypothetical protein [Deltaproteobacteria bacterium]
MSEYQFYEFQAVDRRLAPEEMAELREFSTRARISPTGFVNEYHWGSFRGDEDAWMERYFDGFAHLAHWGSRRFSLRLPEGLLPTDIAARYAPGASASVRRAGGLVILTLRIDPEDSYGDWIEGEGWLDALLPIRAELARGDLRALYLGWLLCAQWCELDDDDEEPPVPEGLGTLSAAQVRLIEFLEIDPALVEAASEASAPLRQQEPTVAEIRDWIENLAAGERDDLLARFITGEDPALAAQLMRRVLSARTGSGDAAGEPSHRRTVGELMAMRERADQERRRIEAEAAALERERREREAAVARTRHLDRIAGSEPTLWRKVDELIATSQPKRYDEAITLLEDLRDLAARSDATLEFQARLDALRDQHARKRTLIDRLDLAGLRGR